MKDILISRAFLKQFDKGTAKCELPDGYKLQYSISYEREFSLSDKKANKIANNCAGIVTYKNNTDDGIVIVEYENLIQALGNRISKCCDFIIYSKNEKTFFICNELSISNTETKWPDARKQFSATVLSLLKCDEIKEKLSSIKNKYCVLTTKIEPIVSPENMVNAFNNSYEILKLAEQLHWTVVERMGFTIWESNLVVYENYDTVLLKIK